METMISYHAARRIVLDHITEVETEPVDLNDCLGRTLAESVESREMIPPFDNSAMDGFAVRAAEVAQPGVELPVVATIGAGSGPSHPLPEGACMRIMTGAPIPPGADAVIPVEQSVMQNGHVQFTQAAVFGASIRRAGENLNIGDRVLESGVRITPAIIGVLATLGYARVSVARRPTVSIFTTGDELVDPAEEPGPGRIRDSNGPVLRAQTTAAGGHPIGTHRIGDDPEVLYDALAQAISSDAVVISGGVSMGEFDYVRETLDRLGFQALFWKVKQRPGKPLLFGVIGGTPVFGLPGNPVSTTVCFEQYVRPALGVMLGRADRDVRLERALLDADVHKSAGLHHFVRGRFVDGDGLRVVPTGPQGSHISQSLVLADCLIHLPEEVEDPPRGTEVVIERLLW